MLNWILIAVAAIVVVFIAVVALQPADFRVPWEKLDPQLKRTYEGPQAGTGAKYHGPETRTSVKAA